METQRKSDPGIEVYTAAVSPVSNGGETRSEVDSNSAATNSPELRQAAPAPAVPRDGAASPIPGEKDNKLEDEKSSDSVTSFSKSGGIEIDTSKVHVTTSDLEARPHGGEHPEAVRYSVGLEPVSNLEILNAPPPPAWMQKKRWYILGCGIILLLVVAIIVIGLVAGLVLARRGGDSSSGNSTTPAPPPTTNSTAALSACGTHPSSIRRQVLTAAMLKGDVYIFARGLDGAIWYRVLSGSSSSTVWKSDWARWIETEDTFAGPPTAVSWTPNGDDRMHVFAPANNGKFNVLGAGYLNGSFPSTWQNLGEPTASAVALCHLPGGWVSSSAGAPDRIDQWVVNRDSRAITHDFWNSAIENFQEPATYVDWEASPSAQASASGLGVVCRRDDPIHTVLMFANGTDSVRFRHYTGSNRFWNPWVDIGGNFIGDPVLLPIGGSSLFYFFGINATGAMQSFYWTDAVGLGYRPPWTYLGGNFSSVPAAVLSTPDPSLRLDAVALGADGKMKHKGFLNQTWDGQWEDLGIEADSAPFLFQYEADAGTGLKVNRTLMAAIGADNQLRVAIWESASTKPWRELVAGDKWAIAGGNLTAKSMCD